jgi:hypothetical protein
VTCHAPTLTADLHGKDLTLRYLREGTRIVDDLEYTDEVSDDERIILFLERSPAEDMSQVPWNVPPPAVRTKELFLPNGQWLFLSLMDERGGRRAEPG